MIKFNRLISMYEVLWFILKKNISQEWYPAGQEPYEEHGHIYT